MWEEGWLEEGCTGLLVGSTIVCDRWGGGDAKRDEDRAESSKQGETSSSTRLSQRIVCRRLFGVERVV